MKFPKIDKNIKGLYTVPYGVTEIPPYAFCDCVWLKSVEIPDTVTKIGEAAFFGCSALTSIIIPNSVRIIDDSAFQDCI